MGRELNLGRYTLRSPTKTQDFRVGSFYRKQKAANKGNRSPDLTDDQDLGHISKRLALEDDPSHNSPQRSSSSGRNHRDSLISDTTSFDSSTPDTSGNILVDNSADSTQVYQQEGSSPPVFNRNSTHCSAKTTTQTTNDDLIIDTENSTQVTQNTHESFTVNLNPFDYSARGASTPSESSVNLPPIHSPCDGPIGTGDNVSLLGDTRKKLYPKQLPYEKIMSHVVFVMSGFENPRRAKLRDMAIAMGAKYSARWNRSCTHLFCAFKNTPKYKFVMSNHGRVVREHWIQECHRQKQLLDWRDYKLGRYPYTDSEEEPE